MSSLKYTKIEITPEAYLALEAESILRSKTLKKLASELIVRGVSKESLEFAQRVTGFNNGKVKFSNEKMEKIAKDIGIIRIKIDEEFLIAIQKNLYEGGYPEAMLYIIQHTASLQRDELQRVLIICQYYKLPPTDAGEIIMSLNNLGNGNKL